jgi:hypothetical protein
MHSPGTRVLARGNSGWGIHFLVAVRKNRNRASAQADFIIHKSIVPRAALGIATVLASRVVGELSHRVRVNF